MADRKTIAYYNQNAAAVFERYQRQGRDSASGLSPVSLCFLEFFPRKRFPRILEIGGGSGRDALTLLHHGYDVHLTDASPVLIQLARETFPELKNRSSVSILPELSEIQDRFDGILCSAVLMHIPEDEILDSIKRMRDLLKEKGQILISISSPNKREVHPGTYRDRENRLFYPYTPEAMKRLFERTGFMCLRQWDNRDSQGRDFLWHTMLFAGAQPAL